MSQEHGSSGRSEWILFLHSKGQYIVSGSDDGSFFIWEKETTNLVRILQGDESIVNCLQPHPSYCFLATSGIDPVVRLWNPRPEVNRGNSSMCRLGLDMLWECVKEMPFIKKMCHAVGIIFDHFFCFFLFKYRRQTAKTGVWWKTWRELLRLISGA